MLLDYQIALNDSEGTQLWIPLRDTVVEWVETTLKYIEYKNDAELTVRIVGQEEIVALNETFRKKKGATNVLSFPFEQFADLSIPLLGDIVICAEVVKKEADEQHKSIQSHWAHMLVHGTLHLCGYDHQGEAQAQEMEAVEKSIMNSLGFVDPYKVVN